MLKILPYILIVIFASILGWIGTQDKEQQEQSESEYCRMVKLYKDTKGSFGWPDYENSYSLWCTDLEVADVKR